MCQQMHTLAYKMCVWNWYNVPFSLSCTIPLDVPMMILMTVTVRMTVTVMMMIMMMIMTIMMKMIITAKTITF